MLDQGIVDTRLLRLPLNHVLLLLHRLPGELLLLKGLRSELMPLGCLRGKLVLGSRGRVDLLLRYHLLRQMLLRHNSLRSELLPLLLGFFSHNPSLLGCLRYLLLLWNGRRDQPLRRSCLCELLRDTSHARMLRCVLLRDYLTWKLLLRDNLLRRGELMLRGKLLLLLGLRHCLARNLMLCDLLLHCLLNNLILRDSLEHLLLRNTLHNLLRSHLLLRNSLHSNLLGLGHLLRRGNLPLLNKLLRWLLHHMPLRH